MPIVARELTHVRPQHNGSVRVQEILTSAKGQVIPHSYLVASEAVAIIAMNARDMTEQLENVDFTELLVWVQAKNAPGDFDFVDRDLILLEGEERLFVWFATNLGDPAISIAWWIEDMNPPTYNAIRDRVGVDITTGSRIQGRAIALTAVEPSFDAVEDVG